MAPVKVALIGAGSFVFGPSVLEDAIRQHRLAGLELALVDPDQEMLQLMAAVGQRLATDEGVAVRISAHTEREPALDGADFVICSAARQLQRRFEMDCQIIARLSPGHLITEFGGIGGISYSLRQIALVLEITADMKRLCPRAWLLNSANPLPRLCQAAQEDGIRTAGFCSASLKGYAIVWRLLGRGEIDYPFEPAVSQTSSLMGGLNHLSWLLEMRDQSGADLLAEIRRRIAQGATAGEVRSEELCRQTGFLPMPGDAHIKDFLIPTGREKSRTAAGHGGPELRPGRIALLQDIAAGRQPWGRLVEHRSWERPIDLVAALGFGRTVSFPSINLLNRGQMPGLPDRVFVETPATADAQGVSPRPLSIPATVLPFLKSAAAVTDAVVRAARQRSRGLLAEAVELDPTILDKRAGLTALDECLRTHADLLPVHAS